MPTQPSSDPAFLDLPNARVTGWVQAPCQVGSGGVGAGRGPGFRPPTCLFCPLFQVGRLCWE